LNPHELLPFDTCGPISAASVYGHKYFITAHDDSNHFTWVILLKSKSESREQVQNCWNRKLLNFLHQEEVCILMQK